jgi:hypothetical protein
MSNINKYLKYKKKYLSLQNQYAGKVPNFDHDKRPYSKYNFVINQRYVYFKDISFPTLTFDDDFNIIINDKKILPNLDKNKFHLFANIDIIINKDNIIPVSYTHLRAHET